MDLRDSVAIALASQEPRRSAEIALGQLIAHLRVLGAALYRVVDSRVSLWSSRGLDKHDLGRAATAWAEASEMVLAGNAFAEEQFALIPLRTPPVGILYIGAGRGWRLSSKTMDAVRRLESLLVVGMDQPEQSAPSPIEAYLETTPPQEVEREQLGILLRRNEWNITRVARILGVSRVTVYTRMEKLKLTIDRPQTGRP